MSIPPTRGQCEQLFEGYDDECELAPLMWGEKKVPPIESSGWRIGRDANGDRIVLCPEHVQAEEAQIAAALDGLPFDEEISGA